MKKNKLVLRESCCDIRRLYYLSSLTYRDMVRIGFIDEDRKELYNKIQKYEKFYLYNKGNNFYV